MNAISQAGPISQGYSVPVLPPLTTDEPKDVVTLTLTPERMSYKPVQAFVRQMALEGTPLNLNFSGASEPSSNLQNPKVADEPKPTDSAIARQAAFWEAVRKRFPDGIKIL